MEHIESGVKVFKTKDYSRFQFIEGNRSLNDKKIKNIIKDIEAGIDVLKYYPIQVYERDGKLEIEDGQHRFKISKVLLKPVHYIIMDQSLHLSEVAKVNSNVEKWNAQNFINCYIKLENEHYIKLAEFLEKYKISVTLAIQLLIYGHPALEGIRDVEGFQRGNFEVKHWDEATALADILIRFKDFKWWKSRAFFMAIYKVIEAEKVKINDVVDKVIKNLDKLEHQDTWKQYVENFESIYNFKRTERVIIF